MRRFTVYRPAAPETHDANQKNPPDQPQFEGVIFSDGTCVLRWRTAKASTSVWQDFDTMSAIHGHPEYGTYFVWHDGGAAQGGEARQGGDSEASSVHEHPVCEADAPLPIQPSADAGLADEAIEQAARTFTRSVYDHLGKGRIGVQTAWEEMHDRFKDQLYPLVLSALRQPPQAGVERDAVLEEAARLAESLPHKRDMLSAVRCLHAGKITDAIRALKSNAPTVSSEEVVERVANDAIVAALQLAEDAIAALLREDQYEADELMQRLTALRSQGGG